MSGTCGSDGTGPPSLGHLSLSPRVPGTERPSNAVSSLSEQQYHPSGSTIPLRLDVVLRFMYAAALLWRFSKRSGVRVEYDETLRRGPSELYQHRASYASGGFIFVLALLSCRHSGVWKAMSLVACDRHTLSGRPLDVSYFLCKLAQIIQGSACDGHFSRE